MSVRFNRAEVFKAGSARGDHDLCDKLEVVERSRLMATEHEIVSLKYRMIRFSALIRLRGVV